MPSINIIGTGRLDERDSAFPQAVQLPEGDILCSFCVGGGPHAEGSTEWARSVDGGQSWYQEGAILLPKTSPPSGNTLKLSLSPDGKTVYAYGSYHQHGKAVGDGIGGTVLCRSSDGGRTWSHPQSVAMPNCDLGSPHGLLALSGNRCLAPAITRRSPKRIGEQALVAISDDGGRTWPKHAAVFEDPNHEFAYTEMKLALIAPGRIMAVCWTATMGHTQDLPNHFKFSNDNGSTWGPARSTGILGQTLTPISLGDDRLLVLYNRRHGYQGIVMCLVTFTDQEWTIHREGVMYDARAIQQPSTKAKTLEEKMESFAFGFPTVIRLQDGSYLATHWSREQGHFGIRWTKLQIDW